MSLRSNSNRKNQLIYEDKLNPKGAPYKEAYQIGNLLGKGGFASCFEITTKDGKKHAVKIIPIQNNKPENMEKIKTEIKILSGLDHPGIVRYITNFSDSESIYILMELCANGSLGDVLKKRKHITEPETRFIVYQMVQVIQYMKSKHIIHRDVKLANIFLDQHFRLKLGDFGLAAVDDQQFRKKKSVCGTPNYIAPEVIEKKAYSYEVDVWSTGVLIFTLLHGVAPFETKSCKETYERIRKGSFKFEGNKSVNVSKDAKSFIRQILQINPENRLKIEEFMSHPFMQNYKIPQQVEPSFGTSAPSSAFLKKYSGTSNTKKQTAVVKKEPLQSKEQFQKTMTSEISLAANKNSEMKYCNLRSRESYYTASNKKSPQSDMVKIEIQDSQPEKPPTRQQSCQLPFIPDTPKKLKPKEEQEAQSNRIKKKFRPNFQIIEELSSEKIKGIHSISPSALTPHKMSLAQPSSILQASPNTDKSTKSMIAITKTMVNLLSPPNQPCQNKLAPRPMTREILQRELMDSITPNKEIIETHPSLLPNRTPSQLKPSAFKLLHSSRKKISQQIEIDAVKVLTWLNRWNQYGTAFLLSNRNTCIIFNDHSKILMTRDKKIHYFQKQNAESSNDRIGKESNDQTQLMKRAQQLLKAQQELRVKTPFKPTRDDASHNLQADTTYVKSCFSNHELIMLKLSNNNLHCIFNDNSSIFVETCYHFVVFYPNYLQSDSKQFCTLPVLNAKKVSDQLKAKLTTVCSYYQQSCMNNIQAKESALLFGKLCNNSVSGKMEARKA